MFVMFFMASLGSSSLTSSTSLCSRLGSGLGFTIPVLGTGLHTHDWAVDSVPLSSAPQEKIGGYSMCIVVIVVP